MLPNPKSHRLSDQEKLDIVEKYKSGISGEALGREYGVSGVAIRGLLSRRKIEIRPTSDYRKYKIKDVNFFKEMNTEESLYFLGFLFADGNHSRGKNSGTVLMSLAEHDKEILERLNNLIHEDRPLISVKVKGNRQPQWALLIQNAQISDDLLKWGLLPNKTYISTWPEWLKKEQIRPFLLGLWDGDGHISTRVHVSGTEDICMNIQKFLKENLDIDSLLRTRHPERNNNIRTLYISGKANERKFVRWLYEGATIFMERKYKSSLPVANWELKERTNLLRNADGSLMNEEQKKQHKKKLNAENAKKRRKEGAKRVVPRKLVNEEGIPLTEDEKRIRNNEKSRERWKTKGRETLDRRSAPWRNL